MEVADNSGEDYFFTGAVQSAVAVNERIELSFAVEFSSDVES